MVDFPHVIAARQTHAFVLEVSFSDGVTRLVDFTSYIQRGGVFAPLADPAFFERFFIDLNTVCWPNGADVAPERLYEIGVAHNAAA